MTILHSDDLHRTETNGIGTASDGHTYTYGANQANWACTTGGATVSNVVGACMVRHGSDSLADSDQKIRFQVNNTGEWLWLWARGTDFNNSYRARKTGASTFVIEKYVGGNATAIAGPYTVTMNTGTWYWLRFLVQGSNLSAKVWQDGTGEPAWQLTVTDTTFTAAGWFGFGGNPQGASGRTITLDTYEVDSVGLVTYTRAITGVSASMETPSLNPYGASTTGVISAARITDMTNAGMGWHRSQINWFAIETAPGVYDWTNVDTNVSLCNAAGISYTFVLQGPPSFGEGVYDRISVSGTITQIGHTVPVYLNTGGSIYALDFTGATFSAGTTLLVESSSDGVTWGPTIQTINGPQSGVVYGDCTGLWFLRVRCTALHAGDNVPVAITVLEYIDGNGNTNTITTNGGIVSAQLNVPSLFYELAFTGTLSSGSTLVIEQSPNNSAWTTITTINGAGAQPSPIFGSHTVIDTTCADTIAAGTRTVTPASMSNIGIGSILTVDTSTVKETVTVTGTTGTTFTAVFANAHSGTWDVHALFYLRARASAWHAGDSVTVAITGAQPSINGLNYMLTAQVTSFCQALTHRYTIGDGANPGSLHIESIEIYNEGLDKSGDALVKSPYWFVQNAASAYPAIKAINPHMLVGCPAHLQLNNAHIRTWQQAIYLYGGGSSFDYSNTHYYPGRYDPSIIVAGQTADVTYDQTWAAIHAIDTANGFPSRPIRVTETGWSRGLEDFFTEDTSSAYTSSFETGGSAGTWTFDIANTRLTGTGGSNAVYYQAIGKAQFQEGYVEVDLDWAEQAGVGVRWVDGNNAYLCVVNDASSATTPNTVRVIVRLAGGNTTIATASISFTRGTRHTLRLDATGHTPKDPNTVITVLFDGTEVISTTDTTMQTGGYAVMYENGTGRFSRFTVVQQGNVTNAQQSQYMQYIFNSSRLSGGIVDVVYWYTLSNTDGYSPVSMSGAVETYYPAYLMWQHYSATYPTWDSAHTQLLLYGSSVLDGTLATASKMAAITGGIETSRQTVLTGTNVYGEIWSQGSAGVATVASIPATPTGHGWIFYPGAGTFAPGDWSAYAAFAAADWGGAGHTTVTLRFSKYSGGSYTSIGSISANITALAKTTYTFAATAMPEVTMALGDGVYLDLWWWDNSVYAGTDNPTVYESTSASVGVLNAIEITTAAFTQGTMRSISGVSVALSVQSAQRTITGVSAALGSLHSDDLHRTESNGIGTASDTHAYTYSGNQSACACTPTGATISNVSNEVFLRHSSDTLADADMKIRFQVDNTAETCFLWVRGTDFNNSYRARKTGVDTFVIGKYVAGVYYTLAGPYTVTMNTGTWYWLRFQIQGANLSAKIWQDGTGEPNWQLTVTDTTFTSAGWFGFGGNPQGTSGRTITFDAYEVNPVGAVPFWRSLSGISAATKAFSIGRVSTPVSAAFKAFGVPRPASGVNAAIGSGYPALGVYVSGTYVPAQQAGISFEQRLDDRAGGSFAVVDETGTTYPLQERQQVELVDNVRSLTLYRGFLAAIGENALSPSEAQPALMRTVTLEDLRALAEKRLCDQDYTNWTAGNIAADLVRTRLASEQITTDFAMRRDHSAAGWGQGTLTGVQATNGYLELAQAGADVTHIETTTADFASGTLSGVTATNNALSLTKYKAMRFSAYAGGSTGVNSGNYLSYWSIWQGAITINDNDYIDYYIWHSSESVEATGGVDIVCSDGATLRDTHVEDQNSGIDTHPNASLQGWATDRWYYRKIGFPSALNGKSIKYAVLAHEGDKEGYHCFYVRSLKLHSVGGAVRTTFFETSIQRIGFMRQIGYYKPWIILRDVYALSGSRTAPSLSLTGVGIAGQSSVSWHETNTTQPKSNTGSSAEESPKQVIVSTSIDGGDTWQECENGKAIPSLPVGMDLTGKSLLVRQTLNVGGPNPELTPALNDCTVGVEAAYNSSKVDVLRSYAGSEMTDGTNALCGYQAAINTADGPEYNDVSGLKMNGWRKNWNTGERVNHILYGNSGPFMGIRNGTLFLHSNASGGDAHVRLQDAGTYSNLVMACTIRPPTNGNAGIIYHTTYWGNNDDTYGYLAYIQPNQIGLGKGTNNSTGGFTFLSYVAATLEADQWYRLKVVYSTSDHVHHVFVDDVEYITHTDTSYTSGGVGLRVYSTNDAIGYFDAFGVSGNTTLAQATRTAPSVSLSTAGSVGDSRIWWAEDLPGSTTLAVQTSINGGSTYSDCTNGSAIPGLTPGLSLSGISLLVKILLNSDSVAYTPALLGITWQVQGAFSASGSRVAPVLSASPAVTVGSSSVSWDADIPSSGTLGVDSSLNGSSWTALGASGDPVAGLVEQGDCWWDTFDTDTHASYTYTVGHWQWDTANSRLVTQSTTDTLLKSGVDTRDAEIVLISDRMDSLQILLRYSGSGHYALQLSDNSGVAGPKVDFERWTPGGGSVMLHTDHAQNITRGVYHVVRVVLSGATYAVWLNGVSLYTLTDGSPLAGTGQCGLWFNAGTSYTRDLAIRPLGQDAVGVNVYTRTRLTSTSPTESPKVKDLVACVRNPFIATGATIPQTQDWAYKKSVAEALDEIVQSSEMGWRFNENYQLVMQPRDGQFAPFVLWQGENGTIDGTTLPRVQRQSPTYCNRYYVTGAVELVEWPESKLGNGVDISWSLAYPIDSIVSIEMNDADQSFGIKDTDTGKTFYYTPGDKTLSLDASLTPPNTQIDIVYIARKEYRAMAEDTDQQTIVAALEGSTGIVEMSEDIGGLSKEAADARAAARLPEHARLSLSLSLMTRTSGLAPGQLVTVVIPKHALEDLQLLITGVSTQMKQRPDGTLLYWYTVEATTGPSLGSWARALSLRMIQKGGG